MKATTTSTRERWEQREQQLQSEDRSTALIANESDREFLNWLVNAERNGNWIRVDLSLLQRRATELGRTMNFPAHRPRVHTKRTRVESFIPALDTAVPVIRHSIVRIDDDRLENVRVQQKRVSLSDAASRAPYNYLTNEEVRRIGIRIVNHLNIHFFRGRARRTHNPERFTALICQHDVNTRRHLHMLFALPDAITIAAFKDALRHILKHEPFAFANAVDDERSCVIEPVQSLRDSVFYNADERKSLSGMPILYIYPPRTSTNSAQEQPCHNETTI